MTQSVDFGSVGGILVVVASIESKCGLPRALGSLSAVVSERLDELLGPLRKPRASLGLVYH